jgi:hypothetical protein
MFLFFLVGRTEQFFVKGLISRARKLFIYGRPRPTRQSRFTLKLQSKKLPAMLQQGWQYCWLAGNTGETKRQV